MKDEELLKSVGLFSKLDDVYLKYIAEFCIRRKFKEEDTIIEQSEPGIGLYIIISGKVKIIKEFINGEKLEVAVLGPGEFFGEMSVLDNTPRSANVIAIEEVECLVLTAWDFKSKLKAYPEIALELLPVLVKRFRETNETLLALSRI